MLLLLFKIFCICLICWKCRLTFWRLRLIFWGFLLVKKRVCLLNFDLNRFLVWDLWIWAKRKSSRGWRVQPIHSLTNSIKTWARSLSHIHFSLSTNSHFVLLVEHVLFTLAKFYFGNLNFLLLLFTVIVRAIYRSDYFIKHFLKVNDLSILLIVNLYRFFSCRLYLFVFDLSFLPDK